MSIGKVIPFRIPDRSLAYAWIFLVFMAVSAWCVDSFCRLWSFSEQYERNGIQYMLDYKAHRPFVYRLLVPTVARLAPALTQHAPASVQNRLAAIHPPPTWRADPSLWEQPLSTMYIAVYLITYVCTVVLMWLLFAIGRVLLGDRPGLALYPIAFMAVLPITFLHGGYFYDFSELMFIAAITLALLIGRDWLLAPLLVLAVLNKESNILLSATTLPLLLSRMSLVRAVVRMALLTLPALAAMLSIRAAFAANEGVGAEFQLWQNLGFWMHPSAWLGVTTPYAWGIAFPRPSNVLFVALAALTVARAWRPAGRSLQQMLLASAAVSLPLFLLFCFLDEMRNLSLMFIPLYCLVVAGQRGGPASNS